MTKQKLSEKQISLITELTNSGESLNKISKELNKSKTTIYYHFRKIKGRTVQPISILSNDDELVGEFVGLFAGDGSSGKTKDYKYRTYLHFNIADKSFTEDLTRNVLLKLFGKKPMLLKRENRLDLFYYSKNIHLFIGKYLVWDEERPKTYSVRLKSGNHSKRFMIGFIRGSLDSDGYLSDKVISFATVSPGLKNNIVDFLSKLDISHSSRLYKEKRENRVNIYHINVFRKDFARFLELIKPRNVKEPYAPAVDSEISPSPKRLWFMFILV